MAETLYEKPLLACPLKAAQQSIDLGRFNARRPVWGSCGAGSEEIKANARGGAKRFAHLRPGDSVTCPDAVEGIRSSPGILPM